MPPDGAWLTMAGGVAPRAHDGGRRDGPSAGEIRAMLAARVESLAAELLPNGHKAGRFWQTSSVDDYKTGSYSLKVDLSGHSRGLWRDFGLAKGQRGAGGSMLDLIAETRCNGDIAAAFRWAKSWLGIEQMDRATLERARERIEVERVRSERDVAEQVERRQRQVRSLWHGRDIMPLPRSPAEAYLRGRQIDLSTLGHAPGSIRYRPDVWCPERKGKFPAMLACIMGLDGSLVGVHRTYLDIGAWDHATRSGRVVKAKVADAKLTLGASLGGHIPLWKGACKRTLRDIAEGTDVYVSEGIEDGLSVALASPDRRVIAGVSLSKLPALDLPPQMGALVFIGQNDPPGGKAAEAFERAIEAHQRAGRTVRLMMPPPDYKDWNDVLTGKKMGAQ
jgi:hypothetical protein